MIAYPDTSFLCAMYRPQDNSPKAAQHFSQMVEPLHVTAPLLYEFRQSVRWQVYFHTQNPARGFDRPTAEAALAKLRLNLSTGAVVVVPVDWADMLNVAERLSAQHTWTSGYRGFDLLHVATALHLGAEELLTFDARQSQLAALEGLKSPFF